MDRKPYVGAIVLYREGHYEFATKGHVGTNGATEHPAIVTGLAVDGDWAHLTVFLRGHAPTVRSAVMPATLAAELGASERQSCWLWPTEGSHQEDVLGAFGKGLVEDALRLNKLERDVAELRERLAALPAPRVYTDDPRAVAETAEQNAARGNQTPEAPPQPADMGAPQQGAAAAQ